MRSRPHLIYLLLLTACLAGYAWLLFTAAHPHGDTTVCLVKNATGIPCPSCGSTRAVVSLLQGDLSGLVRWNPLGLLIALVLLVAPLWIGFDVAQNKTTLHAFFLRTENFLQRRWVALPAVLLVIVNWIWSFSKGL